MKGLLFTYLLTYGGAFASLINPFIGVLVYICFAVLRPEFVWPWSVPAGNYSRIVAIALLIGWALKGFGRWDLGRGKAIILALVGYLVWTVISASQAPNQELAWEYVDKLSKIVLPVLVGITTINSVRRLKILAWVILLSQAYPALELNLTYLGGYNQLREDGFASMDNNSYAISLVTCSGLAFFLFLHSERWWQKGIAAASAAVMVHAVLFSNSRGGMLGLIVLGLTIFAIMPKGWKECMGFLLAVIVGLSLAGAEVRARFQTSFAGKGERDASAESRLELWAACWDTMLKHPVVGVGPDHMPLVMDQYGFKKGKEAHTLWLNSGAELGFPGMFLLVSYYGFCLVLLWPIARGKTTVVDLWYAHLARSYYGFCLVLLRPIAREKTIVADPWLAHLARMVIASLSGFAVSAQFVALDFLEPPYYIALLGAGILKLSASSLLPVQDSESLVRQPIDTPDPADFV